MLQFGNWQYSKLPKVQEMSQITLIHLQYYNYNFTYRCLVT